MGMAIHGLVALRQVRKLIALWRDKRAGVRPARFASKSVGGQWSLRRLVLSGVCVVRLHPSFNIASRPASTIEVVADRARRLACDGGPSLDLS